MGVECIIVMIIDDFGSPHVADILLVGIYYAAMNVDG